MDGLRASPVELRPVEAADLDVLFELMRDPESVQLAAFTPDDPDDIASFVMDGQREVTYWIDRAAWGQHIASRPLRARAASDNAASLCVLEKAGFKVVGTETSNAPARGREIEETILRLTQA